MEHIMMISHKERLPYTNICTEGVFGFRSITAKQAVFCLRPFILLTFRQG